MDISPIKGFGTGHKKLQPFRPKAFYVDELDWFIYVGRDCSYTVRLGKHPHLAFFMDGEEVIGFKVLFFSELPREVRQVCLEATHLPPDNIIGIKELLLLNAREGAAEIDAEQSEFIAEFRRRTAAGLIDH